MSNYELRRKLRHMTENDQQEVLRFAEYLKDKQRMTYGEFKNKWAKYEAGDAFDTLPDDYEAPHA